MRSTIPHSLRSGVITEPVAPEVSKPVALERHYSVSEVAELWSLGYETVRKMFLEEPGVLKISMPRLLKRTREPKVTLRIPASVVQRFHEQRTLASRLKAQAVPPLTRPERQVSA